MKPTTIDASIVGDQRHSLGLVQDLQKYIEELESIVGFSNKTVVTRAQVTKTPAEHIFAKLVREDDVTLHQLLKGITPFSTSDEYPKHALSRILRELKALRKYDRLFDKITAPPMDANPFHLIATICGHLDTPYEGGIFHLKIEYPRHYPHKPPRIRFLTRVFHPNINSDGSVCADLFTTDWSPTLCIAQILITMTSFLDDPNADEALDWGAALQYKNNRILFDENAQLYTRKYATGERVFG